MQDVEAILDRMEQVMDKPDGVLCEGGNCIWPPQGWLSDPEESDPEALAQDLKDIASTFNVPRPGKVNLVKIDRSPSRISADTMSFIIMQAAKWEESEVDAY